MAVTLGWKVVGNAEGPMGPAPHVVVRRDTGTEVGREHQTVGSELSTVAPGTRSGSGSRRAVAGACRAKVENERVCPHAKPW